MYSAVVPERFPTAVSRNSILCTFNTQLLALVPAEQYGGGGGEYNWGECDTTGTEFDEVTRLCAGLTAVPRSFIVYIGPSGVMCNSMELWQIEEGEETLRE